MRTDLKPTVISALTTLFWTLIGSIIITYFFISTFLSEYSPLPLNDASSMFFGPLFCGIMIGIILKESEMPALTYSTILITLFSLLFIFLLVISPILIGLPVLLNTLITIDVIKYMALSSIFILPMTLIGMIMGKALGETLFLTRDEKKELGRLRDETMKWHEELTKK